MKIVINFVKKLIMSLFYKKVTVYADHRKLKKDGTIKAYGKMRATKYPYAELCKKNTLILYDDCGNKVMQYTIGGKKPIIHFHGYEGTRITGKDFVIETRNNRSKRNIAEQEKAVSHVIDYEPIIKASMIKFLTNKEYFLSVKSNYSTGTLLWCADVAKQTYARLDIPEEALKETLKRLFYE